MPKYYEIISTQGLGVISVTDDAPDSMLDTARSGRYVLGEITREQFETYFRHGEAWTKPISTKRFTLRVDTTVVLIPEDVVPPVAGEVPR